MPIRISGNCLHGRAFRCRGWASTAVLLIAALGCSEEAQSPTAPEAASQLAPELAAATTAALPFRQLSAGIAHTCGVTTSDRMYCWGDNGAGELGNGNNTGPETCRDGRACSKRPLAVVGGLRFRNAAAGSVHSCGVAVDAKGYCWGSSNLGDGTSTAHFTPVAIAGGLQFRQLSAGGSHTCGVTIDNQAYCWGSNAFGEFGDGTHGNSSNRPVAVTGGLRFRQVSVGAGYTCGLSTADQVYCWGRNDAGQLGDGTEAEWRFVPAPVAGGRTYRELDAGETHACAVTTGYRAFCWGNGRQGQLGTGRTYLSFWPRPVGGRLSFRRVSAGGQHSCGETRDSRVYCWGTNSNGQLGDGTTTQRLSPVPAAGGRFFAQASAGWRHTCAKTSDGAAYCWGQNTLGQLGDGTRSQRLTPTAVIGPS